MSADKPTNAQRTWVKCSASHLKEVLQGHKRFLEKRPNGKRAALSYHELSDTDLNGRDLSESDLTGVRLRQAQLDGTLFRRANLFCADLSMASLRGADLTCADLRGICLRGAEMSDATLWVNHLPAVKESMISLLRQRALMGVKRKL